MPRRTISAAMRADRVVLPTPPFPEIASFIACPRPDHAGAAGHGPPERRPHLRRKQARGLEVLGFIIATPFAAQNRASTLFTGKPGPSGASSWTASYDRAWARSARRGHRARTV